MRPSPALLGVVALFFLVSLLLPGQTATTTNQPTREHEEDEATRLWDEVTLGQGHVVPGGSCAAAGANGIQTKRKLTTDVVAKALLRLAFRLPIERAAPPPPVKRPLLKGPSVVRTPEERQQKVEQLKSLRGSLLEDRHLRHAVAHRDRLQASGQRQCGA